MGYTHYWKNMKFSRKGWKQLSTLTEAVIKNLPENVKVAFEEDETDKPVEISDKLIRFNGIGEQGHETFWLENKRSDFSFCKTARKPYDLAVCSVLILASLLCEDGSISSDGIRDDYTDREWLDAVIFLADLFPITLIDREKVFKAFENIPDIH